MQRLQVGLLMDRDETFEGIDSKRV